ncbi:MAG: PqqD family protein [Bacteroidaceae bacterium]|nr:PqqD family protein [Bacteroidaceae bacterium]
MRIKKGFTLRNIGADHVVVPEGIEVIDFNKLVSLNKSAKYLWEKVVGRDFTVEEMAKLLTEKYNVSPEDALTDAGSLIERWREIGLLEE